MRQYLGCDSCCTFHAKNGLLVEQFSLFPSLSHLYSSVFIMMIISGGVMVVIVTIMITSLCGLCVLDSVLGYVPIKS